MQAGRDIHVHIHLEEAWATGYLAQKGPQLYRNFLGRPRGKRDRTIRGSEGIYDLRHKLLMLDTPLKQPIEISVRGTLFPFAQLASGWWDQHTRGATEKVRWRDDAQRWLFRSFEIGAPSWDFTWDVESWSGAGEKRHFIAQLGEGDEAGSLPVLLSFEKAKRLIEHLQRESWSGTEARVTGLLCHRRHLNPDLDRRTLALLGGLMEYCLWLDDDDKKHGIERLAIATETYSGYLWKCIAPRSALANRGLTLHDVYFVSEYIDFANGDAVAYGVEALERKVQYIRQKYIGEEVVLMQKSSTLVPGNPLWTAGEVYKILLGKGPGWKI